MIIICVQTIQCYIQGSTACVMVHKGAMRVSKYPGTLCFYVKRIYVIVPPQLLCDMRNVALSSINKPITPPCN